MTVWGQTPTSLMAGRSQQQQQQQQLQPDWQPVSLHPPWWVWCQIFCFGDGCWTVLHVQNIKFLHSCSHDFSFSFGVPWFQLSECAIWFSWDVTIVTVKQWGSCHPLHVFLLLLLITPHAVRVCHCLICSAWPDLPEICKFWVLLVPAATEHSGLAGLVFADFLKGTRQGVQVPRVLVLGFPQTQNHRWWTLLTCKVAQVPVCQEKYWRVKWISASSFITTGRYRGRAYYAELIMGWR